MSWRRVIFPCSKSWSNLPMICSIVALLITCERRDYSEPATTDLSIARGLTTPALFQIVTLHELDADAARSFDERGTHRGAAWQCERPRLGRDLDVFRFQRRH